MNDTLIKRSNLPAVLSLIVVLGYFGILIGMMSGGLVLTDSQALLLMLGSLSTGFGMVLSFWFGTTAGSQGKNELLAKASFIQPEVKTEDELKKEQMDSLKGG